VRLRGWANVRIAVRRRCRLTTEKIFALDAEMDKLGFGSYARLGRSRMNWVKMRLDVERDATDE